MWHSGHLTWWFAASHSHCDHINTAEAPLGGGPESPVHWSWMGAGLESPTHIPRNMRFHQIQHYITQRAYLTPAKINRYFHRTDAACPHCRLVDADLLHMLWECPSLQGYWSVIADVLSRCTERNIPFRWETCILHLYSRSKKHKVTPRFLDVGLAIAKRLITRRWKAPHVLPWRQSVDVG